MKTNGLSYNRSIVMILIAFLELVACNPKSEFQTVSPSVGMEPTKIYTPTITESPSKETNTVEVIADSIDVLSCPLPTCSVVYQFGLGSQLEPTAQSKARFSWESPWLQVEYENGLGWIYADPNKVVFSDSLWNELPEVPWEEPTSVPLPTVDPARAIEFLCHSNVLDRANPLKGKTVRFNTPIDINPNGIKEVLTAIEDYELKTGGAVTFNIVDTDPAVGITVVEGDAVNRDGSPGCGNVSNERDAFSGHDFRVNSDGVFNSLVYVHLGSKEWKHNTIMCAAKMDDYNFEPYKITEHELAHAVGAGNHLWDFQGAEGLAPELNAMITLLYSMPPGTDISAECSEFLDKYDYLGK